MSSATDFFITGGSNDPFGPLPKGVTVSSVGSDRMIMIDNTETDFIRTPLKVQDNTLLNLGYRRVDQTGSGGASEWVISWTTIATFSSINVNTLANGQWGGCCIKDSKFYAGFYDQNNAYGDAGGPGSYVLRADLITGTIEDVFRIDETLPTAVAGSGVSQSFTASTVHFWEVLDNGNIKLWYDSNWSESPLTIDGIAYLEYNSDGSVLVDEGNVGDYDGDSQTYIMGTETLLPAYVSEDQKVILLDNITTSNDYWLLIDDDTYKGIIDIPNSTSGSEVQRFITMLIAVSRNTSASTHNIISDEFVTCRAIIQDGVVQSQYSLKYLNRTGLDLFLKETIKNLTGINL